MPSTCEVKTPTFEAIHTEKNMPDVDILNREEEDLFGVSQEGLVVDQESSLWFQEKLPIKTMAVFDWDDTLLATSHLSAAGYRLDQNNRRGEVDQELRKLDCAAQALIELALQQTDEVFIITNAESGWVELSSRAWLPSVASLLNKVTIVSARSTFEAAFPNSPSSWKLNAFQECLLRFRKSQCTTLTAVNIMSFGDSCVEREACRSVASSESHTTAKSVKFAEQPSIEFLRFEIAAIAARFQALVDHEGELDLMLPVMNHHAAQQQ